MKYNKNNNTVKKTVKGKEEEAPNLIISIKQASPKKFRILLIHPNTKEALYDKVHVAHTVEAAFAKGREIKAEHFSTVETWCEEIKHIPSPKRGKMKLKTKENITEENNFED